MALQKALWANIAELRLIEARHRQMRWLMVGLIAFVIVLGIVFVWGLVWARFR